MPDPTDSKPNVIVSRVVGFEPPLDRPSAEMLRAEGGLSVELAEGGSVRLDPADERSAALAQVLEGLRLNKLPVYLEVDPESSTIERLLIPHVTRVHDLRRVEDGSLSVELERSHARHFLRRSAPGFEQLERRLRSAVDSGETLIVTENDAHEILDVRDYVPGPEGPPDPLPKRKPIQRPPLVWRWIKKVLCFWCWPIWPWWWFRCISRRKAQQVFDAMNATSCAPLTVPPPCIPFLYPDDGCWGRAHEMCRLMIQQGLKPKKVWIQGTLHVATKNNPSCGVNWGWHVAPTLCVRRWWFFWSDDLVIDPSLFTTPVTQATWKGVQGDPGATLTPSAASIFYLWGNQTDPTYTKTNQVLATYRLQLQLRSINQGPPPYAGC